MCLDILSEVLLDADLPQKALAVEVKYLRHLDHQVLKLVIDNRLIDSNKLVDKLFIHKKEPNQILHSALPVFAENFCNLLAVFVFHRCGVNDRVSASALWVILPPYVVN